MKRILFISNVQRRFIEIDEQILREHYEVKSAYYKQRNLNLLLDSWHKTQNIDLVFAWFASWHAFPAFLMAKLRNIPTILITGGYDVANEPNINYGLRRKGLPRIISGATFRLTNLALPFSEYSKNEALANTPLSASNIQTVLLGVPDEQAFKQPIPKEDIVLTIAALDSTSIERKGIRLFIESARYLPHLQFYVVGKATPQIIEELRVQSPSNVTFTGFLDNDALINLQKKAKVYVQASHHEGFGLAVAESMLARAIPVVSQYGSLPEVVEDTGVYIEQLEPESLAKAIQKAMNMDSAFAEQARQRILTRYPLSQRKEALYKLIDEI